MFGVILGTGCGGGIVINGKSIAVRTASPANGAIPRCPGRPVSRCRASLLVRQARLSGNLCRRAVTGTRLRRARRARRKQPARTRRGGDQDAIDALDRHADRLARGLAVVVNLLDPDVIVIGGGLSNMSHLYTELPRRIPAYAFSDVITTPVLRNRHGDSSGVRGAAWLVADHVTGKRYGCCFGWSAVHR